MPSKSVGRLSTSVRTGGPTNESITHITEPRDAFKSQSLKTYLDFKKNLAESFSQGQGPLYILLLNNTDNTLSFSKKGCLSQYMKNMNPFATNKAKYGVGMSVIIYL